MTAEEAIEIIKSAIAEVEWECPMDYAAAFEEAIKALEKQIKKKPKKIKLGGENNDYFYECQNCEKFLAMRGFPDGRNAYCDICSQAIDWSEESENKEER